jgi:hypothetical protein
LLCLDGVGYASLDVACNQIENGAQQVFCFAICEQSAWQVRGTGQEYTGSSAFEHGSVSELHRRLWTRR